MAGLIPIQFFIYRPSAAPWQMLPPLGKCHPGRYISPASLATPLLCQTR